MSAVEKLQKLIKEFEELVNERQGTYDENFKDWLLKLELFLTKQFGIDNIYWLKLKELFQYISYFWLGEDKKIKLVLEQCLEDLQEKEKQTTKREVVSVSLKNELKFSYQKVFIVHGHDGELKHRVARLIEKQGIEAVILDEQVNGGDTIIEKFEKNSDVGGAICLFTADDMGKKKGETSEGKYRPRQNVVFEAGYFMGKLGRKHVVIIADREVELPSDMSGIVYTDIQNWKVDVLKGLKKMGYSIDMNKLFEE